MYYLFKIASVILPRLPHWVVRPLANVIGLLAWLVARRARKQATANMCHVLGAETLDTRAGRRQLRKTVRSMFQNNVRNYLEVFFLPYIPAETMLRHIDIGGLEYFEEALALGKGVILFTAHLGPFNYLVQWLSIKGYQSTIPVEHLQDQRILDLILKLRRSHGVHFIPLGGSAALRSIIQALRNNQVVVMPTDRAIQGESIEKPFFGEPARLPLGPVSLAQRTGAALIGGFGWYSSPKHITGQFVPLSLQLTGEDRATTDKLLCGITERMEWFIKAHPEQWAAFSPIWTSDFARTS
jgi:phosphatidylinositol dimannoside acyltransferase